MFKTAKAVTSYVHAGKATITLSSKATGTSFTFKITRHKTSHGAYFVSLLNGPDNVNDYRYAGMLYADKFKVTPKSTISAEAPSAKAFAWFANRVLSNPASPLPEALEIRHEGTCGRCNRKLTVPSSIDSGIGPECASKLECA